MFVPLLCERKRPDQINYNLRYKYEQTIEPHLIPDFGWTGMGCSWALDLIRIHYLTKLISSSTRNVEMFTCENVHSNCLNNGKKHKIARWVASSYTGPITLAQSIAYSKLLVPTSDTSTTGLHDLSLLVCGSKIFDAFCNRVLLPTAWNCCNISF